MPADAPSSRPDTFAPRASVLHQVRQWLLDPLRPDLVPLLRPGEELGHVVLRRAAVLAQNLPADVEVLHVLPVVELGDPLVDLLDLRPQPARRDPRGGLEVLPGLFAAG